MIQALLATGTAKLVGIPTESLYLLDLGVPGGGKADYVLLGAVDVFSDVLLVPGGEAELLLQLGD